MARNQIQAGAYEKIPFFIFCKILFFSFFARKKTKAAVLPHGFPGSARRTDAR